MRAMRSLLFVPGDSARKFEKARVSGADALILDLEDSVAPRGEDGGAQIRAGDARPGRAGPDPLRQGERACERGSSSRI